MSVALGTAALVLMVAGIVAGGATATATTLGDGPTATTLDEEPIVTTPAGGQSAATAISSHVSCTAEPTAVAPGETVTLDASGTNSTYVSFDIDGDGSSDQIDETDFIIDVSYETTGTYTPEVWADGDPEQSAPCGDIVVTEPPVAAVQLSPSSPAAGETITFDASGSSDPDGDVVEYRWDFDGDGVTDRSTASPTTEYAYDEAGAKVFSVTVVDNDGVTGTATRDLFVEENEPPTANLVVSPTTTTVGSDVTFDASDSVDPDGTITEYRWDIDGDGQLEGLTEGDRSTIVLSYEQPGSYVASVTVVDDAGKTATASRDVLVERRSSAVCRAEPTNVGVGETVTLDASDSNASFISFDVDGDGEYERGDETDFIVNVTYPEEGTYTPAARADGDPEAVASCGEVVVDDNDPPTASFTIDPRPGIVGESVSFDASASSDPDGDIAAYRWDFDGDGATETTVSTPTVEHVYNQTGGYSPTLTVVDTEGATDMAGRDLRVEQSTTAVCTAEPTRVQPGETVTLDASGSQAAFVSFDVDGDGEYDIGDETDLIVETSYDEPGTYEPSVRADQDPDAVDSCGEVVVNAPPEADFTVDPRPGIVGESVSFDASGSSDPDGTIVEYQWDFDGDGATEETTTDPTATFTYAQASGYAPRLTVVDDDGANASTAGDLIVEQPRVLTCTAEPTEVEPGETVTLDASGSEGVPFVEFDVDGDGEYERGDETDFVVETSYDEEGTYEPTARYQELELTQPCGEIVVERPPENDTGLPIPEGDVPFGPLAIGAGGLLGGLGLLYYFFGGTGGGGGGGGGGGRPTPKPKPKPSLGGDEDPQYETGVFELPPNSGRLAVPVGFEPDLVFFSATNAARTDAATDRTAGWSRGLAFDRGEETDNYSLTVADDAQTTDQATCAADDDSALQLVRHGSDRAPGRVRLALAATTADGFEVDVQIPGNDPFASGIRVHYQAIKLASGVEAEVGTFTTPTEPGTQVVDLGLSADHISLLGSAAVTEPGRLWTTDRGVGMTGGHAVAEDERVDQAVWGASAWPRSGHDSAAVASEGGLNLLYQDGKNLAGRTRATVADLGSQLRLRYDRVYNGPHKLGSTARHVVSYLAMNGGESMRPAVGAVPMPGPDERLQVDCGFEPAMVEVTLSPAPLGEEVGNWAAPQPFGWSEGTAIADDDGLRQYILHHAFTPAPRAGSPSAGAGVAGDQASADGAASTDGGRPGAGDPDVSAGVDDLAASGDVTPATDLRADPAAQSPAEDGDTLRVQPPTAVPDDGLVGISMLQDEESAVVGRDECRIAELTPSGFDVAVDRIAADGAATRTRRPTLIYRAWPAVDGREGEGSTAASETPPQEQQPGGATSQPGVTGTDIDAGSEPMHDTPQTGTDTEGTRR